MSRILPLPQDAVSQIHSSRHITTLQGVGLALLENCLDAEASKVEIDVDFRRGCCTVEDNGTGILPAEFGEDGGLGKLYHTSRRGDSRTGEYHGNHGTYLASLAALSLLSITSRHRDCEEHATITFHQAKTVARHFPAPVAHELSLSPRHGTRIIVRDLFGNMPVRVKQRSLSAGGLADRGRPWQELIRGIVALLLAWPNPCAVKIHEAEAPGKVVNLAGWQPSFSTALTEKSLNQLEAKSSRFDLRDAIPILFQAGIAAVESRPSWVPLSASTASISVKGAICLDPAPTKHGQFISIGIHPCRTSSGSNELYDSINHVFATSSFGCGDDGPDIDEAEIDRRRGDRRYKSDGYTQKQLRRKKGVDRWPMFVLKISLLDQGIRHTATDNLSDELSKAIVDVLKAATTQWLIANHLRPQQGRRRKNDYQQSPTAVFSSSVETSTEPKAALTAHSSKSKYSAAPDIAPKFSTNVKKRRLVDLPARFVVSKSLKSPRNPDPISTLNSWSAIRGGKFYIDDAQWKAKGPSPVSGAGSQRDSLPNKQVCRQTIASPALEAGQGHSVECSHTPLPGASTLSPNATTASATAQRISSDDFGSIEDADLLALDNVSYESHVEQETTTVDHYVGNLINKILDDPITDWTDPVTKQTFQVNARTGTAIPFGSRKVVGAVPSTLPTRQALAVEASRSTSGEPLRLSRRPRSAPKSVGAQWLPGFLKHWDNPVFARQGEERINVLSFDDPGLGASEAGELRHGHQHLTRYFHAGGAGGKSKLSKAALRTATIIKQVDGKFILCKFPSADSGRAKKMLVLVDQHAASERVILEGLLAELCAPVNPSDPTSTFSGSTGCKSSVPTVLLERPPRFQVSTAEHEMFTACAPHFARWGILYDLSQTQGHHKASPAKSPAQEFRLDVRALPSGIAERCVASPKLLIDLLRSELWAAAENPQTSKPAPPISGPDASDDPEGVDPHSWLKCIGSCPKPMLDMLNSRACRSAIMFNDELSVAQCEELLADLSMCAFPFMCAHGRVSMVPLFELGGDARADDQRGLGDSNVGLLGAYTDDGTGFVKAYECWRNQK